MKKKLFIAIFIFSMFVIYDIIAYQKNTSPIIYSQCTQQEKKITTKITFIIDKSLLKNYPRDLIMKKIDKFVHGSDEVMKNSCLPIKRVVDEVSFMTIDKAPTNGKEYSILYDKILNKMTNNKKLNMLMDPSRVMVVLFDKLTDDIVGQTYPYVTNKMALVSSSAAAYIMEHELGHLSLADHELSESNKNDGPQIAHGYHCGRYRSLMNQNVSDGELSPFYSTPQITAAGEPCGNIETANNTEQLRRWSKLLRRKVEIISSVKMDAT
jgi:hypothetical protein